MGRPGLSPAEDAWRPTAARADCEMWMGSQRRRAARSSHGGSGIRAPVRDLAHLAFRLALGLPGFLRAQRKVERPTPEFLFLRHGRSTGVELWAPLVRRTRNGFTAGYDTTRFPSKFFSKAANVGASYSGAHGNAIRRRYQRSLTLIPWKTGQPGSANI
jgi:hypothetical protein